MSQCTPTQHNNKKREKCFTFIESLNLLSTLRGWCYYNSLFTDEEIGA
jgi:hypothetical protein